MCLCSFHLHTQWGMVEPLILQRPRLSQKKWPFSIRRHWASHREEALPTSLNFGEQLYCATDPTLAGSETLTVTPSLVCGAGQVITAAVWKENDHAPNFKGMQSAAGSTNADLGLVSAVQILNLSKRIHPSCASCFLVSFSYQWHFHTFSDISIATSVLKQTSPDK